MCDGLLRLVAGRDISLHPISSLEVLLHGEGATLSRMTWQRFAMHTTLRSGFRLPTTRILPASVRTLTTTTVYRNEGDTGALRAGGQAAGDAFTRREQAAENYYISREERKKLESLRSKLAEKEAHLAEQRDNLGKHRDEALEIVKEYETALRKK